MDAPAPTVFLPSALRQPRFGELMRHYRRSYGLTIRQAAAESGISRATWDRGEGGADLWLSSVTQVVDWMVRRGSPEVELPEAADAE